ncbi:MAG TPA: hypothetical protein VFC51_12325 [Chloroflexota bacterium]|nr:hypothetical protein [Chloroflexota bacterium]
MIHKDNPLPDRLERAQDSQPREPDMKYYAMRTDRWNRPLVLRELRQGRLRQGWGYAPRLDLRMLRDRNDRGEQLDEEEIAAWKNWRMLGGDDGFAVGTRLLLSNLPNDGQFVLVEMSGAYDYQPVQLSKAENINDLGEDYGHILPVSAPSKRAFFAYQDERVTAPLRRSMTSRSRIWSLADHSRNLDELWQLAQSGDVGAVQWDRAGALARVVSDADAAVRDKWHEVFLDRLRQSFQNAELEEPCKRLLEAIFRGADVQWTAGPTEHGADLVVSYEDPVARSGEPPALSWLLLVQVKAWEGAAHDLSAVDQIDEAFQYYRNRGSARGLDHDAVRRGKSGVQDAP